MKKLAAILIVAAFIFSPAFSHAKTTNTASLQAQIQSLLKMVTQLQVQLAAQTGSNQTPTISTGAPASCIVFYSNLYLGSRGADVTRLQQFLRTEGDFTYPTNTGYFGPSTERAVQKWQAAHGVVSYGSPETTGYGVVGPQTQEEMRSQTCTHPTTPDYVVINQPSITSATYAYGKDAAGIHGINLADATVYFDGKKVSTSKYTYTTDTEISFLIPTKNPGTYPVYVVSSSGKSNTVNLVSYVVPSTVNLSKIDIISPVGGAFIAGSNLAVTWSKNGSIPSGSYYFVYLKSKPDQILGGTGPSSYYVLAFRKTNLDYPTFNVDLPSESSITPGGYYLEVDVANSNGVPIASATSKAFVIDSSATKPTITVTSPNGGETYKTGDSVHIKWNTSDISSSQKMNIALEVPYKSGYVGKSIVDGVVNNGDYNWSVKALDPFYASEIGKTIYPNGKYRINIMCPYGDAGCDFGLGSNFDESDSDFTIVATQTQPSITLTSSPKKGEAILNNSTLTLKYSTTEKIGTGITAILRNMNVDSTAHSYKVANKVYSSGVMTMNLGKASQDQVAPGTYQIILCSDNTYPDKCSNGDTFTLTAQTQPSITVLSPNGGETWKTGVQNTVTYKVANVQGNVKIYLLKYNSEGNAIGSYLLGTDTVTSNLDGVIKPYNLPQDISDIMGGEGNRYGVRVWSDSQGNPQDYSDGYFSIIDLTHTATLGSAVQTASALSALQQALGALASYIK